MCFHSALDSFEDFFDQLNQARFIVRVHVFIYPSGDDAADRQGTMSHQGRQSG